MINEHGGFLYLFMKNAYNDVPYIIYSLVLIFVCFVALKWFVEVFLFNCIFVEESATKLRLCLDSVKLDLASLAGREVVTRQKT